MTSSVHDVLLAAQARRDAGDWSAAIRLFGQAEQAIPDAPAIKHNLALCHYAAGQFADAQRLARQAVKMEPRFWQAHALIAKISKSLGGIDAASSAWEDVLRHDPGNATALLGLADLDMNDYGDPEAAAARADMVADPLFAPDAELTRLMADLYIGTSDAEEMSRRMKAFTAAHLLGTRFPRRPIRKGRRRIGLISPLLCASPVYYLGWSAFAAIAQAHDLIIFNRGTRSDEGSEAFRSIAREWHDVPSVDSGPLARRLHDADLDILFDLGGWSDVIGLQAVSTKPAARMYKWVGGQSATTGVDAFDGWIGDAWHCPPGSEGLYSEPLINMDAGYVDYTAPRALAQLRDLPKRGVALVGNPAKIGRAMAAGWPSGADRVTLIDRRYVHERTRARVCALLEQAGIAIDQIIVPQGHGEYLRALASCEAIVNTWPYAAGLTVVEALNLGVKLLSGGSDGALFCERHHLSHLRTHGRNPALGQQMLSLVSS